MAAWTDEPSTSIDVKLEATAAQPSNRPCEGTVFRTCPLCEAGCGLEITVRDAPSNPSAVVRIRGDRADVFSHGYICPKGSTLKQLHEDPDRFRSPMLKRDGVHVAVSWDESWEAVHAGLNGVIDRHGRSSLASYLGNPGAHSMSALLYNRPLRQALGSHNRFSASTVDQMPKQCANLAESSSSSILGVREPQSLPTNGSPSAWRRRRTFARHHQHAVHRRSRRSRRARRGVSQRSR